MNYQACKAMTNETLSDLNFDELRQWWTAPNDHLHGDKPMDVIWDEERRMEVAIAAAFTAGYEEVSDG